jgi:hypothetical protein
MLGLVGEDEDLLERDNPLESPDCLLEKGLLSEQAKQVLWRGCATGRPKALTAPPCHDEDKEAIEGGGHGESER